MQYSMILFVAHREINEFMRCADLRPEYKWYVEFHKATFTHSGEINEGFFQSIIEQSRSQEDYWIPAIQFCDSFFVAQNVKILSDGKKEMFVSSLGDRDESGGANQWLGSILRCGGNHTCT